MDFGKFCTLCDLFIAKFNVDEAEAEALAMTVWDIIGCEATDVDMIPTYFENLFLTEI